MLRLLSSLANSTASSMVSQTIIAPNWLRDWRIISFLERVSIRRSHSFAVSRARFSEVVTKMAEATRHSCSAWLIRSAARYLGFWRIHPPEPRISLAPADHIDIHCSIKLFFCRCHINIAGPHDFIHFGDGLRPVGKSSHTMGAPY